MIWNVGLHVSVAIWFKHKLDIVLTPCGHDIFELNAVEHCPRVGHVVTLTNNHWENHLISISHCCQWSLDSRGYCLSSTQSKKKLKRSHLWIDHVERWRYLWNALLKSSTEDSQESRENLLSSDKKFIQWSSRPSSFLDLQRGDSVIRIKRLPERSPILSVVTVSPQAIPICSRDNSRDKRKYVPLYTWTKSPFLHSRNDVSCLISNLSSFLFASPAVR